MGISLLNADYITKLYSGDVFKDNRGKVAISKSRGDMIAEDLRAIHLNSKKFKPIAEKYEIDISTVYAHARKIKERL